MGEGREVLKTHLGTRTKEVQVVCILLAIERFCEQ